MLGKVKCIYIWPSVTDKTTIVGAVEDAREEGK